MSRQSAHDAHQALKIKAPVRCEMLGIKRDRVLQRFDEWAEGATKFQKLEQFAKAQEVPDNDARIRANDCLADIMGCYEKGTEIEGAGSGDIIINLGFLDPERAEALLKRLARRGAKAGIALLPEAATDVAPGE